MVFYSETIILMHCRQSRHGGRGRDERSRRDHRRDDGDVSV